jgi:ankyrin repeat protein
VVVGAHVVVGQYLIHTLSSRSVTDIPQSIVNLSTYIDKLSSLFMVVGRSAPRYQAIALLYPRSTKLQAHLTEYFIVVVGLCRYLFMFGQKSTVQQFTSSLSDSQLRTFQTDLEQCANSIKEQMYVAEAQESSGLRTLTREMFKSSSHQQTYATKMRVLDFCSTYDHETPWKQIRKAGNTSFHTKGAEYQEWKDASGPCTLIYTGKLGSGKSVLLTNIVDDLSLSTEQKRPLVAYFFCRHDVPESLEARTIIGSLVRQLLRTIPDLGVLAKSCENTHPIGDTEKVLEMLFLCFSSDAKVYLVLDGLDECDNSEKETLVQAIWKIQEKLKVLICASFREEPNSALQLIANQLLATRLVSIPNDNPDIEAFIEVDLERCLRQERLAIGDPTLILDIQDALSKGSQGMFLWVALQILSLCSMKTDHAIREALADLPKDLSETFARILQKSGSSDPALQVRTLQLVLAAYRPLTTDELREALSVTPGDATWDPSKILNDVYSALACCGCLLSVDEEEFTVRVVHHSVKQYMLNGLDSVNHMGFSLGEAQRTLADTVVTYLGYGVFGTELSRAKVYPIMAQSAPSKIAQATIGSSSTTRHLATKLLRSRRQPAFDMSKAIAEARLSFKPKPENAFRFYTYAKTHWQNHILYVSGQDDIIYKLSTNLIRSRMSELNARDKNYGMHCRWAAENGNKTILDLLLQTRKIDINAMHYNGWMPLMWAVECGHKDTVKLLLDADEVDVNAKDKSCGWMTPPIRAVAKGNKDIVELLLNTGKVDINAKDHDGLTAMMWAVIEGQIDIVKVLLSVGKADVDAKDDNGRTPLMRAAWNRHMDIVELLLSVGEADIDAKDNYGWTPLMWAVWNRHKDIVEVLLSVGKADINAKNYIGETPLMRAVLSGYKDMVELLLSVGHANVNAKDKDGQSPLMLAAQGRHKDIVEVLLNVGKADINAKNHNGETPLMRAVLSGHNDIVEVLLSVGSVDVDAKDKDGQTPLLEAVQGGYEDIVEVLLSVGKADANEKDNDGWTPLMWAVSIGHKDIVEVLLSVGDVDINATNHNRETPLMRAVLSGYKEIVEMLLSVGNADVDANDSDGWLPLMWAASIGHTEIVELLQAHLRHF